MKIKLVPLNQIPWLATLKTTFLSLELSYCEDSHSSAPIYSLTIHF